MRLDISVIFAMVSQSVDFVCDSFTKRIPYYLLQHEKNEGAILLLKSHIM